MHRNSIQVARASTVLPAFHFNTSFRASPVRFSGPRVNSREDNTDYQKFIGVFAVADPILASNVLAPRNHHLPVRHILPNRAQMAVILGGPDLFGLSIIDV